MSFIYHRLPFASRPSLRFVAALTASILCSCAPPAAIPLSIPMPPKLNDSEQSGQNQKYRATTRELGLGIMGGVDAVDAGVPEVGAWGWVSAHLDTHNLSGDIGLIAAGVSMFGAPGGSLGTYLRVMKKLPNSMLGVELSGGWTWGRLAIPYMKKINDNYWLYISPGFTASIFSDVQLPVGLAFQTGSLGVLRVELGGVLRTDTEDIETLEFEPFPAFYLALSGSLRVEKKSTPPKEEPRPASKPKKPKSQPSTKPTSQPLPTPTSAPLIPANPQPSSLPASEP